MAIDKRKLSERDFCTKVITTAIEQAERDKMTQIRIEVQFTNGRIIGRGKTVKRGKAKRADFLLTATIHHLLRREVSNAQV